jgi:uncharacterized protein YceK
VLNLPVLGLAHMIRCLLLASALLVCLSGCGTFVNLNGGLGSKDKEMGTTPFGGVEIDAKAVAYPFSGNGFSFVGVLLFFGGLIDFPFCLVLDTLTLPYTIPKSMEDSPAEKDPDKSP